MKNSSAEISHSSILTVPQDLLLYVFRYLDLNNIAQARLVCKLFLCLIDNKYWDLKFRDICTEELKTYLKITKYGTKKVVTEILNLDKLLKKTLEPYQATTLLSTLFTKQTTTTRYQIYKKEFNIHDCLAAITNDQSEDLISIISRLNVFLPYFNTDNPALFREAIVQVKKHGHIEFCYSDLHFATIILPILIKARAFECYRLVLKAFFSLNLACNTLNGDPEKLNYYSLIQNSIRDSKDIYFIKEFIDLWLQFSRHNTLMIVQTVLFDSLSEEDISLFKEVFELLGDKKQSIFVDFPHLQAKIYPQQKKLELENYRNDKSNLANVLEDAAKMIKNPVTKEDLNLLYKTIGSLFEKVISEYKDEELEELNDYIPSFGV